MSTHSLKIRTAWFERIANLEKTAEIRRHDRDFQVGDNVELWEIGEYGHKTGRHVRAEIQHILPADQFREGLTQGYCLLSLGMVGDIIDATEDER